MPRPIFSSPLDSLAGLDLADTRLAVIAGCQDRQALHLDGLALLGDLQLENGAVEVDILSRAACYPGIAFRCAGEPGYELIYAIPHCANRWDSLQYDPVFNGSNTWQNFFGPCYQKEAAVPNEQWFTLRVDFTGERAAVRIGDGPSLVIEGMAHQSRAGRLGLWTYLPAFFSNVRVYDRAILPEEHGARPQHFAGAVLDWTEETCGRLPCEPNGVLNLNRFLTLDHSPARLSHTFSAAKETTLRLSFGFSDELTLSLDGQVIFTGSHTWKASPLWEDQAYVDHRAQSLALPVAAGEHRLSAEVKVTEPFGWGLALGLQMD